MKVIKTFSIIIPTYNRAVFLDELLESLTNQIFKDFEVIISDDGSSDNTKTIVDNYLSKLNIKYIFNENWGGPARPRNLAIENSIGEYLCFLDSDDLWTNDKLLKVYENLEKNIDVYYHNFISNNKIIGDYSCDIFSNHFTSLFVNGNRIVNSSLVVRKDKVIQIGKISESKELIGVEDFDLILKLAYNQLNFKKISKALGEYRNNETSISSNQLSQIKKTRVLYKTYYHLLSSKVINKNKSLIKYMYAKELLNRGKIISAKKYLLFALINGSFKIKCKSFFILSKSIFK